MRTKSNVLIPVMDRIVQFEARRSRLAMRRVRLGLVAVTTIIFLLLWVVVENLREKHAFDMLILFREDAEIIGEYWRDTLDTFWAEVPDRLVYLSSVFLFVGICIVFFSRRIRHVAATRIRQVLEYERKKKERSAV